MAEPGWVPQGHAEMFAFEICREYLLMHFNKESSAQLGAVIGQPCLLQVKRFRDISVFYASLDAVAWTIDISVHCVPALQLLLWLFWERSGWLPLAFHVRCTLLLGSKVMLSILSWVILSNWTWKRLGLASFLMFEIISRNTSRIPPMYRWHKNVVLMFIEVSSFLPLIEIYFVSSYIKYFACISMGHAALQLWPLILQTGKLRQSWRHIQRNQALSVSGFAAGSCCSNLPVLGYSCISLSLYVRPHSILFPCSDVSLGRLSHLTYVLSVDKLRPRDHKLFRIDVCN